jgi:predicted metal-binding membrane protein
MKVRIVLSVVVALLAYAAVSTYELIRSPVEAGLAVSQIDNSVEGYAVSQAISHSPVPTLIVVVAAAALLAIWIGPIVKVFRNPAPNPKESDR